MSEDNKEIVEETDEQIKARLNPPDPVEEPVAEVEEEKAPEPTEEEITADEPKPVDLPNDDDDQGVQDGNYDDLTDEEVE